MISTPSPAADAGRRGETTEPGPSLRNWRGELGECFQPGASLKYQTRMTQIFLEKPTGLRSQNEFLFVGSQ